MVEHYNVNIFWIVPQSKQSYIKIKLKEDQMLWNKLIANAEDYGTTS